MFIRNSKLQIFLKDTRRGETEAKWQWSANTEDKFISRLEISRYCATV